MAEAEQRAAPAYRRQVGERLRLIRRQKRLSLQEVESRSDREFRASVLGAYERGERAISVPRLLRLAEFYDVPVDGLLPDTGAERSSVRRRARTAGAVKRPITIDLTSLRNAESAETRQLARFVEMIQMQRRDFNGRVLTVRRDDLRTIACILDTSIDGVADRLEGAGVRLVI